MMFAGMVATAAVWLLFVVLVVVDHYRYSDAACERRYRREKRKFERQFE